MVGRGRWGFQLSRTALPRRSPVAIWSRSWSRCSTPIPMATGPHQPGSPRPDASQTQRQVPDRAGRDVQSVHSRLDHLLQPLLQDAIASNPPADRRLCHQVGTPQVQADAPPDQWCTRLVRPVPPGESIAHGALVAMPWQRPSNRSRMNREVHVRFWESPEVKVLRATRHSRPRRSNSRSGHVRL
jgi:hypothetical protein